MGISANDWTAAKGVLVLLAQTLALPEERMGIKIGLSGALSIAERIFNKPLSPTIGRFLHTVHLLPTLREAQNQMAHWIEVLAGETKAPGTKITPDASLEIPPGRPPTPTSAPLFKQVPETEAAQLASRANNLILQVRSAIQALSSSQFLINPQSEPLRNVLVRLKPLVDEYIEALSKSSLDSQQEGTYNPFKERPALKTAREQALYKQGVPLSILQASGKVAPKAGVPLKPMRTESDKQTQEENYTHIHGGRTLFKGKEHRTELSHPDGKKSIPEAGSLKRPFLEERGAPVTDYPAKKQPTHFQSLAFDSRSHPLSPSEPKSEEAKKRVVQERPQIPNAFPGIYPPTLATVKKKKKKRFLFNSEEENDSDRPHS